MVVVNPVINSETTIRYLFSGRHIESSSAHPIIRDVTVPCVSKCIIDRCLYHKPYERRRLSSSLAVPHQRLHLRPCVTLTRVCPAEYLKSVCATGIRNPIEINLKDTQEFLASSVER